MPHLFSTDLSPRLLRNVLDSTQINLFCLRVVAIFEYFERRSENMLLWIHLWEGSHPHRMGNWVWHIEMVQLVRGFKMNSATWKSLGLSSFPLWRLHKTIYYNKKSAFAKMEDNTTILGLPTNYLWFFRIVRRYCKRRCIISFGFDKISFFRSGWEDYICSLMLRFGIAYGSFNGMGGNGWFSDYLLVTKFSFDGESAIGFALIVTQRWFGDTRILGIVSKFIFDIFS